MNLQSVGLCTRALLGTLFAFSLMPFTASVVCAQTVTPLYTFTDTTLGFSSALVQGSDGDFYGTVSGPQNPGAVFKITLAGSFTLLYSFTGGLDAGYPVAALVQGNDGDFYGTTMAGGKYNSGTIFKINPTGSMTTIYNFDDGASIEALVQGSDGNFYGATAAGGTPTAYCGSGPAYPAGCGTLFKISPSGNFTLLYTFQGSPDGQLPSALIQGSDGNFYGSSMEGGSTGQGTIFRISSTGSFTLLYTFGANGDSIAALVEGSDGNFYGTSSYGDALLSGANTVYKITPAGKATVLAAFDASDGFEAVSSLFLGSDANFYGLTERAMLFKVTPTGNFSTLYRCTLAYCWDQWYASAPVQGSDGNFYGTTTEGNAGNVATVVLKLVPAQALPAPVELSLSQSAVASGTPVTLSWKVLNAFSTTMQQCYGFVTTNGVQTALNKQSGTYNVSTKLYTGSSVVTPASTGTYNYALTCGGQESGFATLTVVKDNTSTAIAATPNPASVGQPVTLTATVTNNSGSAKPSGTVTFYSGSTALNTVPLNSSGVATSTASTVGVAPGSYSHTASYSGDSNYSASTSSTYAVKLNAAPTSTSLTASPSTVTPPETYTLTATVKRSANAASGVPTGTVTFYYLTQSLGSATLNSNGVATITVSSKGDAAGNRTITATYAGDSSDVGSKSSSLTVTVK